jgi:DNA modification methylase
MINLLNGNCLDLMRSMPDNSVDSIVTDPPYGLNFMGKKWDCSVPSVEIWAECLRVLKPGGHLLAFAGTRTQHRMAVNIEDAGFEIRDMIAWVYGSGFPKSLDVSKAIDKRGGNAGLTAQIGAAIKAARESRGMSASECDKIFCGGTTNWSWFEGRPTGQRAPTPTTFAKIAEAWPELVHLAEAVAEADREVIGQDTKARSTSGASALPTMGGETVYQSWDITAPATESARQWQGWGTALKPALEPITVARKPLISTVAANVLEHGTGALNIDGCRVGEFHNVTPSGVDRRNAALAEAGYRPSTYQMGEKTPNTPPGRWPANLIHDGSDEILKNFPSSVSPWIGDANKGAKGGVMFGGSQQSISDKTEYRDAGSAARFFYCAKASKRDREEGLDDFAKKASGMVSNTSGQHMTRRDEGYEVAPRANHHPTVKPTDLMRYLCRLVTPPKGIVLDPFMGSGSTGKAAVLEGFGFVGMELDADFFKIAQARVSSGNQSNDAQCELFDGVIAP